jgi:spermidine synthase
MTSRSARFEELDWRETRIGAISLRRRVEPTLGVDVYEVKLGDEFLMSSLFTVAEVELGRLGLAPLAGTDLDVVVGGLGLGYTAAAVLEDPRVRSLDVVEALGEVIGWHDRELLPVSAGLVADPRCRFVHGDFFAMVEGGHLGGAPGQRYDAVLVDIDHSPRHVLDPGHAGLYTRDGLTRVRSLLTADGVFALWSDDPPDAEFEEVLRQVFPAVASHVVAFDNPLTGGRSANTVYVAVRQG